MDQFRIHTLDLMFQSVPEVIASYLVLHDGGAVLVECGPGSTIPALVSGLEVHGLDPGSVSDLLLTHIHLDHGGAAGWLASRGVRVHVHHRGAPHLIDPQRLVASARRIYGEDMDRLWGEIIPAPEGQVTPLKDGDLIVCGGLRFQALDTPGHANHHMAYLLNGTCFSGDVGGIRLPVNGEVELPMPPPELDLALWVASLARLMAQPISAIAPTHFGIYPDAVEHLTQANGRLAEVLAWLKGAARDAPDAEIFRSRFEAWREESIRSTANTGQHSRSRQLVNPPYMSAQGLYRYWLKSLEGEGPPPS